MYTWGLFFNIFSNHFGSVYLRVTFKLFYTLLGNVYLRVIFNLFYTLFYNVHLRFIFNLFFILLGPVQTSNFTCAEPNTSLGRPKYSSSANWVELDCKSEHDTFVVNGYCLNMAKKIAGKANCGNEELVFLACPIKEGRRRPLQMQLALSNLVARRKRFLNLTCLLSLLISQRNITVPRPVRSCRRLKRNTGWWKKVCNTFSDARFKKTFRVSRETFTFILNRTCSGNCDGRTNNVSNEACYLSVQTRHRRLSLYHFRNVWTRCLHCLLNLSGSLSSLGGPFVEWDCVNWHAPDGRGVQTKNSRHGRILAISLLLDSNRW